MRDVLTVILAGGVGQRLHPLTLHRAKPAVPFGGIYRIIDFTLSNCINSECRRILVMVQYKCGSLTRHLQSAWNFFRPELGEFVNVVPPQMRVNDNWYLGTADAIYQNLFDIDRLRPEHVMILSGDHVYKMDYRKMLEFHKRNNADLTIAAIEVPARDAHRFGILECAENGRVGSFQEKPVYLNSIASSRAQPLASMGVYIFRTETLRQSVLEDADTGSSHDFGRDIIPRLVQTQRVFAFPFEDANRKPTKYWRDVGTLQSYWDANMDLVSVDPLFNLYDQDWPLRAMLPMLPPAKFVFADYGHRFGAAVDSMVSPGCIVSGALVERSVLSPGVRVNSFSQVRDSVLMHNVQVGRNCRIRKAIVEKNVHIPDNTIIGYDAEEDARQYFVSPEGITVVCPELTQPPASSLTPMLLPVHN